MARKTPAEKRPGAADGLRIIGTLADGRRLALYDFAQERNAAGGRIRRLSRIEFEGEGRILRNDLRYRAINLARDMARNNPQFRGLERTMRVNVVGDMGKLRFRDTGAWYDAAQQWFNGVWSMSADFADGSTWRECLQLAIVAVETEGDFVVVFDDGILTGGAGSGKLRFFEADQICPLAAEDFAPYAERGWSQGSDGVIYDEHGRIVGVVVTGRRGLPCVPASDAFVLTHDPDSREDPNWRLVRRKFRLVQSRGSAAAIPALQTVIDGYEMAGLEMQTAKNGASRYAVVTMPPDAPPAVDVPAGFDDDDDDENDEGGEGGEDEDAGEEGEDGAAGGTIAAHQRAGNLEEWSGGLVDYAPNGTSVTFDPGNRPNANIPAFLDWSSDLAGHAFGVGHAYARLRADSSYTAFRGDMVLTWSSWTDNQQFLEDAFSDWVARRAIRWGMARGEVPAAAPRGWETGIAWQYPKMPSVDEQREVAATSGKLNNGLTTYRDILGPSWREQLTQFSEEIRLIRELGLPLSVLETVAGAAAPGEPIEENEK